MKKSFIIIGVLVLALLVFYGFIKSTYNGFVVAEEGVSKAWADVESTYQRRMDLIPNLVESVKGYASHEKEVFTSVTNARSKVGTLKISSDDLSPEAIRRFQQAQQGLSGALSRLLAVSERYPNLKANANFLDLQSQLEGTENRINVARTRFNDAARVYNTRIRSFPGNVLAGMFGFEKKPYFKADEGASEAPKVKF